MNCKYVMLLLLCFCLAGCVQNVQQSGTEETPAPQNAESVNSEDAEKESTDTEEIPEGMTVEENAVFEVEEESGYELH